jgi:hypothetical protein
MEDTGDPVVGLGDPRVIFYSYLFLLNGKKGLGYFVIFKSAVN